MAKEVEAIKAAMAQRMVGMRIDGGRRSTQGNNNMDGMDEDEEISSEDIVHSHSAFCEQSQPAATGQRQKK